MTRRSRPAAVAVAAVVAAARTAILGTRRRVMEKKKKKKKKKGSCKRFFFSLWLQIFNIAFGRLDALRAAGAAVRVGFRSHINDLFCGRRNASADSLVRKVIQSIFRVILDIG